MQMKFKSMLIFGILLIALGTWIIHQSNRMKNSERIQQLEDSITQKNIELEKKSDSIKNLTTEVLDFSEDIKNNTIKIESLSIQIKDLSENTNEISKAIKKEQKFKGRLKLLVPDSEKYRIIIGASSAMFFPKRVLESGVHLLRHREDYSTLFIKLVNNEILISSKVYDSDLNLAVNIKDNNWAVSDNLFSRNFNKNSIEIIDKKGIVVFQFSIYEEAIILKGILFDPKKINVFTDDVNSTLSPKDPELNIKSQIFNSKITRIFNHEGDNYLEKRMPISPYLKMLIESDIKNTIALKEYIKLPNSKIIEIAKTWLPIAKDFKDKWSKENSEKSTEEFQDMLEENRNKNGALKYIYNYSEDGQYIACNESDSELRNKYLEGAIIFSVLEERSDLIEGNRHNRSIHYPEDYSYRLFCNLIQNMEKSITKIESMITENKRKELFEKKKIQFNKLKDKEIKKKILLIIEEYKEFLDVHERQDKKISSYLYEGKYEVYFEKSNSFYKKIRKEYSDNFQDEIVLLMLQLISRNPDLKNSVGKYDVSMLEHPHNILGFKEVLTIVEKLSKDFIVSN